MSPLRGLLVAVLLLSACGPAPADGVEPDSRTGESALREDPWPTTGPAAGYPVDPHLRSLTAVVS